MSFMRASFLSKSNSGRVTLHRYRFMSERRGSMTEKDKVPSLSSRANSIMPLERIIPSRVIRAWERLITSICIVCRPMRGIRSVST